MLASEQLWSLGDDGRPTVGPVASPAGSTTSDLAPINLYYIVYGDWSQEANTLTLLEAFGQTVGSSPYFAINSAYANSCG